MLSWLVFNRSSRPPELHKRDVQAYEQESIAFNETFHRIRRDLIASEKNEEITEALKWFDKVRGTRCRRPVASHRRPFLVIRSSCTTCRMASEIAAWPW